MIVVIDLVIIIQIEDLIMVIISIIIIEGIITIITIIMEEAGIEGGVSITAGALEISVERVGTDRTFSGVGVRRTGFTTTISTEEKVDQKSWNRK